MTAAKYPITHRTNVSSLVSLQSGYACISNYNVFSLELNFLFTTFRTFGRIIGHGSFTVADHTFEVLVMDVNFAVFFQIAELSEWDNSKLIPG